jgi:hypothetical protein
MEHGGIGLEGLGTSASRLGELPNNESKIRFTIGGVRFGVEYQKVENERALRQTT